MTRPRFSEEKIEKKGNISFSFDNRLAKRRGGNN